MNPFSNEDKRTNTQDLFDAHFCFISVCLCVCKGAENLRLIFADKVLDEDFKKLSEYGVQQKSVIQIVVRVPGGLTA